MFGDVLRGWDCSVEGWEDVFVGEFFFSAVSYDGGNGWMTSWWCCCVLIGWVWWVGDEMRNLPDFHAEMEMRLGMNW